VVDKPNFKKQLFDFCFPKNHFLKAITKHLILLKKYLFALKTVKALMRSHAKNALMVLQTGLWNG